MVFRKQPDQPFSFDRKWKGKKKGYIIFVNYTEKGIGCERSYYFMIQKTDINYIHNSLWDDLKYKTFEECCAESEKYLDKKVLVKQ